MKRKFIAFDTDNSMSSIGGVKEQEEVFGIRPISIVGGCGQLRSYLKNLTIPVKTPLSNQLIELFDMEEGLAGSEMSFQFNDKAKELGFTGIIIDTLSTLGFQERKRLMAEKKQTSMNLQLWGDYGDSMMRLVNQLSMVDTTIITTCHIGRGKDENGGPLDLPDLKGAAKEEIARFFDCIFYTYVTRDNKGGYSYMWQTRPDGRRIFAKDRLGVSQAIYVPQDLGPILDGYESQGINPKILIIGDSGQGKTRSLSTINSTL